MNAQRTTARRVVAGLALAAALATSACAAGQQAETAQELPTLDGTNATVGQIALRGLAVVTPDAANYPLGSSPQLRLVLVNNGNTADTLVSVTSAAASSWGVFASATAYSAAASPSSSAPTDLAPSQLTPTGTVTDVPAGGASEGASSAVGTPTDGVGSSTVTGTPIVGSTASPTSSSSSASAGSRSVSLPAGRAQSFGVPAANGRVIALLDTGKVVYPGSTISIQFTFARAGSVTVAVPVEISDAGSNTPSPSYLPSSGGGEG